MNTGWAWSSGSGTLVSRGVSGPIEGSGDGVLGGLQAGYNWQAGALVLGVESDFGWSGGRGHITGRAGVTRVDGRVETPWGGTFRGRVGFAMDNFMIYATGGAAFAHSRIEGTRVTAGVPTAFSSSTTGWTWTVGAGVETAIWDRWTVRAEYLRQGSPHRTPVISGIRASGDAHSNVLRAGVNRLF